LFGYNGDRRCKVNKWDVVRVVLLGGCDHGKDGNRKSERMRKLFLLYNLDTRYSIVDAMCLRFGGAKD
jgi:hypothetical protein